MVQLDHWSKTPTLGAECEVKGMDWRGKDSSPERGVGSSPGERVQSTELVATRNNERVDCFRAGTDSFSV